ncbi:hypothetical protein M9434_002046 [Picochlorum sp. BPE23]|nr:hypothetical protein M9434_002046 [Picochlorum sp. BPE23]
MAMYRRNLSISRITLAPVAPQHCHQHRSLYAGGFSLKNSSAAVSRTRGFRYSSRVRASSSSGPENTKFSVDLTDAEDPDDVLDVPNLRDKLKPRPSPFITNNHFGGGFVSNDDRVALSALRYASAESMGAECLSGHDDPDANCVLLPNFAIRAGARETIFMNPNETKVAIVTCGGLCPGLNDVVQGLVYKCADYGVPDGNIIGIQYGFRGFYDKKKRPVVLTRQNVEGIHLEGGTILGTSRGGADMDKIVRQIDIMGIDVVFVVGGNGGNAGAAAIQKACEENNVLCSIVGVPKSIDNDILLIDKCFGFDTAVEEAQRAIICAKTEASSAYNGIGMVKVMGRQSGFIALDASMSSGVVDICLIPEVPFKLQGRKGLFCYIEKVLAKKGHCVICVAEGAGQDILATRENETDASGNPILKDAGKWLRSEIKKNIHDVDMKYIDPSYIIRSIPTTSVDRIYCKILAHNAVHAAFAGFTGVVVGLVNTHYVYLPIPTVIQAPRKVDPKGKKWNQLLASIGQPTFV